nr:hypothetical protein [uncultured archaeon]AQS28825.1 hypothetical protein [uncultured archaeon]AQS29012.1 hypothetical protein [uncultured archaeon]
MKNGLKEFLNYLAIALGVAAIIFLIIGIIGIFVNE